MRFFSRLCKETNREGEGSAMPGFLSSSLQLQVLAVLSVR